MKKSLNLRKKQGKKPARFVTEFPPYSLMQFKLLFSVVAIVCNIETNIKNPFASKIYEGHIPLEELAFYFIN